MVSCVVVMEVAAPVAVLVAVVVVVPGVGAEFARPVVAAVVEPEVGAHCSELEPHGKVPQP